MLVDQEGETLVKVIDFGLAKVTKDDAEDSGTLTIGGFVGTPHFASPEQVEEGEVDIRSDIYSLGATLYFVLTGQSPFSGSVGQIMSQHLYKPLPMEPLSRLPASVGSLVQQMMQKDPNARPQTAQELQKAILACLDDTRGSSAQPLQRTGEAANAFETLDLTIGSSQPLGVGITLLQTYKLVEELAESPYGRNFLAEDLLHHRRVSILVLGPEFLADAPSLSALREAVHQLRKAPHPMLREVYALETLSDCSFLVEEYLAGTTLLDLLRTRGSLSAPEVFRLLKLLAPVIDHATAHGLQHIDITLSGIHLVERLSSRSGLQSEVLRRPLTAWEPLQAKIDSIDFTFSPAHSGTWAGMATRMQGAADEGPRGSYVRLLSLLLYELLGGPRSRLIATGQYTPVAALTQEGNAVLRQGLIDEYKSAGELALQLTATVGTARSPSLTTTTSERLAKEPLQRTPPPPPPPTIPGGRPIEPKFKIPPWLLVLVACLILLAGIGAYLVNWFGQKPEIGALSVRTDPAGATIRLDGKPPQVPPNTFTHVPAGPHQLSATLDNYEPIKENIEVRQAMAAEIHLQLKPIQEIPALSIQTEPAGASILMDGKPPQVPPTTFTHVPLGPHQLSATLNDYEPLTQNIQVRKGMNPQIRLQLKPSQEIAALSVQTEPAGASILLDGKPPQIFPNTFTHVPFGTHQLSAALDDYEPIKQDIDVRRGMAPQIQLKLKPIQELAALSVQTEPDGASILLDGKPPQILPNTFTHVPFGTHQLSAALDDYEPIKQNIDVRRGMAPQIQLKLKPIQEIAALWVQTEPAGASILLDGKPPQIPPATFTRVPYGSHQISATSDNYEPLKQEIQVRKGMTKVNLQLKPIQELAALTIKTEPSGALILLDGKPPESSLNVFNHVPFGPHQLSVALENYEPIKQDIDVKAGMSPEIQLQLKPIQDAGRQTAEVLLRDAQLGDPNSMMKLGLFFLRKGTPNDDAEGFKWLSQAYNPPNNNLKAGAYLGDCYLSGRGTKQDIQKAEEIIFSLANQNVVPAMTLAGRILQYKADVKRSEAARTTSSRLQKQLEAQADEMDRLARQWWERAEKDDWNAAAHLGKCYEEGWGGVPKSEEQAEKRYAAGVSHGNALSMFFYGLLIENKPGRYSEAESFISRAATAGLPSAIKWCKDNRVTFSEKRTEEDR
jgi:serine/threonine protein kinase/TPR repeat protein/arginase family enzyme